MKEKFFNYTVEDDVCEVECDLHDATIVFKPSADRVFKAELPAARNVHAGHREGTLILSQNKRTLVRTAGQVITVYVPEHVTPAIKLSGENYRVMLEGGLYSDVTVNADGAEMSFGGCSLESLDVMCNKISARCFDLTVKGNLLIQAKEGDVLAENTFASLCEMHLRSGNIGLSAINCKEGTFETGTGNVTATVDGCENDYSLSLLAKEGTVNREPTEAQGAERTFKAYADKGNVVVEFLRKQETGEII